MHYSSVWKFVARGDYTWKQLEIVGLALPRIYGDETFREKFKDLYKAHKERMTKNKNHPWRKIKL